MILTQQHLRRKRRFGRPRIYDAVNRLVTIQFGGVSQIPMRVDLAYTARDQLASVTRYSDLAGTTKVGTTSMAYDADMRLTTIQFLSATNTVLDTFGYGFDLADRLQTETTNGSTVTYCLHSRENDPLAIMRD